MIYPKSMQIKFLDGGEELGHGCFRQLKSKGDEERGEGRKDCWPTEYPR